MRLLVEHGADPHVPTKAPPPRRARGGTTAQNDEGPDPFASLPAAPGLWVATDLATMGPDPSGLPPSKAGDPGVYPIHAASGVGYGEGFAGNAHRHAPDAWLAAVDYLVELGADVNRRDHNGYNAVHHAAARGDDELILYLVERGADVTAVSRSGQTTADMANGPVQRVSPIPRDGGAPRAAGFEEQPQLRVVLSRERRAARNAVHVSDQWGAWGCSTLLAAIVVGAVPVAAPAQDVAPWIEMTVVGVDPGRVEEFLAAQRELSALDREAGVPWRSVGRTAVFGDTYRFLILSPLANFAYYDRDTDADPARAAAIARIRRVVDSRTTYALRTTPGIDNPLPDDAEPSLTLVQVVSVVPGREQHYLRVMAEDVPAALRGRGDAPYLGRADFRRRERVRPLLPRRELRRAGPRVAHGPRPRRQRGAGGPGEAHRRREPQRAVDRPLPPRREHSAGGCGRRVASD